MVNKSLSLFAALLCAHCQSIKGSFIAQFSTLREGSVPRTCELPPWNRHGNGCWTAHHSSGSQRHPDEVSSEKNKNRESGFLFHKILSNRSSFHEIGNSLVKRRLENNLNSHLHPFVQLLIVLVCYMVHLCIFTQNSLAFPMQIIPNNRGWFQSIGYDSIAGILSFLLYNYLSFVSRQLLPGYPHSSNVVSNGKSNINVIAPGLPPLFEDPSYESLPWKVSLYRLDALFSNRSSDAAISARNVSSMDFDVGVEYNNKTTVMHTVMARNQSKFERVALSSRRTSLFLFLAYRWTGQLAHNCEGVLYRMAGLGVPMTVAMHRSLVVLLSHLSWVLMGTIILSLDLYPHFFGRNIWKNLWVQFLPQCNFKDASVALQNYTVPTTSKWYTYECHTSWVWWVVGGYLVSSWLFNIADMVNQILLPSSVFRDASEGVVAQLISPENNDIWASIVGYVAPCLTAPIWEELLYRGFMLPTLCLFMPFWAAVVVSGFIFSAHHMSVTGFIPLMVLGMVWAILYAKCKNLIVTVLIHAMWNSRVFLGSWLGF